MGNSASRVVGCFVPGIHGREKIAVSFSEPLDEGLGHSFCYVRPALDSPHLSPSHCDKDGAPIPFPLADSELPCNGSFRLNPDIAADDSCKLKNLSETSFKSISGASVSANTSTPRTIAYYEQFNSFANVPTDRAAAFESTSSFSSLPLQPVPRGLSQSGPITGSQSGQVSGPLDRGFVSGPLERGFMSGPLERAFLSGPLERGCMSGPIEATDRTLFSAPLAGSYATYLRRRRRSLAQLVRTFGNPVKKALSRSLSKTTATLARTQRSLTAPVRVVWGHAKDMSREGMTHYEDPLDSGYISSDLESSEIHNLQWAQGKAGEDRVHVVLSEEHGWLFVGIYDGFNGPDAPDFLMSRLYREIYRELRGLVWDRKQRSTGRLNEGFESSGEVYRDGADNVSHRETSNCSPRSLEEARNVLAGSQGIKRNATRLDAHSNTCEEARSCAQAVGEVRPDCVSKNAELDGQLDKQERVCVIGSVQQVESSGQCKDHDYAERVSDEGLTSYSKIRSSRPEKQRKTWSGKSLLKFKLRKGISKGKERHGRFFPWGVKWEQDRTGQKKPEDVADKPCKNGNADHTGVLRALARALESTERTYLQMADCSMKETPELALMGSCVLVMLMKGEDVYVMNVGDSRAILAQVKADPQALSSCSRDPAVSQVDDAERIGARDTQPCQDLEQIMEETPGESETFESSHASSSTGPPASSLCLSALQLSSDHSTSVEEEVLRIKAEHPDDRKSISNDRVKGRLKVTRAFGAGFLKMPRWNNALLEMFRVDYVGTAPYVSCTPALHHHMLGPSDRFLVLSSDGLYQYLTNEEVVSHVEWFMEKYPDGDPAQHLIEELLFRAAKKAGMDFHELLDIPQGDRRKYHDDVSVMVISLEGKIWRSFG